MRNETSQTALRRLVTGNTCDVQGCYDMALWVVSYKEQSSHRCLKHTMEFMLKASKSGGPRNIPR